MKVRSVMQLVFALVISFAQAGVVAAGPLAEPVPPAQTFSPLLGGAPGPQPGLSAADMAVAEPLAQASAAPSVAPQHPAAPAITLGQAGLSFGYVRTFGETGVAYLADNAHTNFPYGIVTDGNNLWIAEHYGRRAMKFANTGEFLTSFGTAGSVFYQNTSFWQINDIATDPSGNTWIVDGYSLVLKFDPAGNRYVSSCVRQIAQEFSVQTARCWQCR